MTELDRAKTATRLLDLFLQDKITASTALSQWPDIDTEHDELIEYAWHELTHYVSDEDLRGKDKEYEEYFRNELEKVNSEIKRKYSLKA